MFSLQWSVKLSTCCHCSWTINLKNLNAPCQIKAKFEHKSKMTTNQTYSCERRLELSAYCIRFVRLPCYNGHMSANRSFWSSRWTVNSNVTLRERKLWYTNSALLSPSGKITQSRRNDRLLLSFLFYKSDLAVEAFELGEKKIDWSILPYLSLRPTVHRNTPPKATSSPKMTAEQHRTVNVTLF